MPTLMLGVGFKHDQKSLSKSPTLIGWVDYLDIWAESNLSKFQLLDFLDFHGFNSKFIARSSGPTYKKTTPPLDPLTRCKPCPTSRILNKHSRHSAAELTALDVKPNQNGHTYSVRPPLSKASGYARLTAGEAPALKRKLADNVALNRRPSMAVRPVRLEPNAA